MLLTCIVVSFILACFGVNILDIDINCQFVYDLIRISDREWLS